MKLFQVRAPFPIHVDGEQATTSFQVNAGGVVSIEATPMGIVVRRQGTLPDLLITEGWGILEKPVGAGPVKAQARRP